MGFYTEAHCYRAGSDVPIVRSADLARFTERIIALDILQYNSMRVRLQFGQSIDQDFKLTYLEEEISPGIYEEVINYDWHVDRDRLPFSDALALLENPPTSRTVPYTKKYLLDLFGPKEEIETFGPNIYRANLSFGTLKEEVYQSISHQLSGNYLYLSELSFQIEIVELLNDEDCYLFAVGWMNFSVHGNGYMFPWTYEETLAKLREHPVLNQIRAICQEMWPASTTPPDPELLAARAEMGKRWAEPIEAPLDWYWTINGI